MQLNEISLPNISFQQDRFVFTPQPTKKPASEPSTLRRIIGVAGLLGLFGGINYLTNESAIDGLLFGAYSIEAYQAASNLLTPSSDIFVDIGTMASALGGTAFITTLAFKCLNLPITTTTQAFNLGLMSLALISTYISGVTPANHQKIKDLFPEMIKTKNYLKDLQTEITTHLTKFLQERVEAANSALAAGKDKQQVFQQINTELGMMARLVNQYKETANLFNQTIDALANVSETIDQKTIYKEYELKFEHSISALDTLLNNFEKNT